MEQKDKKTILSFAGKLKDKSFFKEMEEVRKERKKIKFKTPKLDLK